MAVVWLEGPWKYIKANLLLDKTVAPLEVNVWAVREAKSGSPSTFWKVWGSIYQNDFGRKKTVSPSEFQKAWNVFGVMKKHNVHQMMTTKKQQMEISLEIYSVFLSFLFCLLWCCWFLFVCLFVICHQLSGMVLDGIIIFLFLNRIWGDKNRFSSVLCYFCGVNLNWLTDAAKYWSFMTRLLLSLIALTNRW